MVSYDGYRHLRSCTSTQDEIRSAPGSEWFLVRADRQTGGRGQRGRRWVSPEGGLYYSLRYPDSTLNAPVTLQLMGAAFLWIDCLNDRLSPRASLSLQWPNDLLLDGQKLGGFLGEQGSGFVYLGIGINVNNSLPENGEFRLPPASLRCYTGECQDPSALLFDWLRRFEDLCARDQPPSLKPSRLEQRIDCIGKRVQVGDLRGVARGLAPDGGLILEGDKTRRTVRSGPLEVLDA